MRITYLLTWADAMGGTERTVLRQANWLAQRHDVEVLGVFRTRDTPAFEIDPRIRTRFLLDSRPAVPRALEADLDEDVCHTLTAEPSRFVRPEWESAFNALTDVVLESALREITTDVLITTSPALMAVAATLAPRRVVLVHQEHRVAELRLGTGEPYGIYSSRMDAIAVLSERTRAWFDARLGDASPRLAVIPNAIEHGYRMHSSRMNRTIMMAGRFTAEKQFDHAVQAFGQLVDDHPDWRLRIFGDGDRRPVDRQVTALRLGENVELMGPSFVLDQEWSKASIALLTSRVESFGLTLIEAMGAGVPPVAYDCPNGPGEVIQDGVTGLLVPPNDIDQLAAALRRLIEDTELRHTLGRQGMEVVERYSVDVVMPQWEALYTELLAGRDEPGWADRRTAAQARQLAQESTMVALVSSTPPVRKDTETWAAKVHAAHPDLVWSGGTMVRIRDDLTPADVAQTNLDLVVEALEQAGIDHWLVRQPEPTFRVAVHAEDRDRALSALAAAFEDRAVYIEALDLRGRGQGTWPAVVSDSTAGIQRAHAVRVYESFLSSTRTLRLDAAYGCRIEFWEKSPPGTDVLVPSGSVAGTQISIESCTPATIEVGGSRYRTIEPFTRTLGGEFVAPVDVVYTWVDGDDPAWLNRKAEALGIPRVPDAAEHAEARFRSRNELLYSLRSIDLFAPWVNRIWIVTDQQTPDWLDTAHPRVKMVDHRDVFADPGLLPTYNSHAIETQLHHIDGLSEHFLYLNDDVFFGRLQSPTAFFAEAGLPKAFPSPTSIPLTPVGPTDEFFLSAAKNNRDLLEKAYGRTLTHSFLHAPHAMRRSVLEGLEKEFPEAWQRTAAARLRTREDISPLSSFAHHYGLMTGNTAVAKIRCQFVNVGLQAQLPKLQQLLQQRKFDVFCLNDYHDGDVPAVDQERIMETFLSAYFPIPSQFERGSARNSAAAGRQYR